MNTTQTTTSQPQLIAVSPLEKSRQNARRRSDKTGMEELGRQFAEFRLQLRSE